MEQRRTVFFVSDGTGITAQMLGHSLLTQFEQVHFDQITLPFIDSTDKAQECLERIEAINFTMAHDDGASNRELKDADVILVGVSRSGKTPTSLYLALQFGVRAANYPLIPEDLERMQLPQALQACRGKLYGLTIAPERLREIRQERRPDSQYADPANCRYEVQQAEVLMKREGIRWINSTAKSIEEIATTILRELKLERHVY